MKNRISTDTCLRLLFMVPAICLLGFTGCSNLDAGAGKEFHTAFIGQMDPHPNADADENVVAANRDWYQMR